MFSKEAKPSSYDEQQHLAFKRNVEASVTSVTVRNVANPVLEARLTLLTSQEQTDEVVAEVNIIQGELAKRETEK